MNIGQAAEESGLPTKTIRYYEDIGLIPPARRSAAGYRAYDEADLANLRFIRRARSLGFTVKDVGNLLELWRDRQRASAEVKALALAQIARIDRKIAELRAMRETLTVLADRCHGDDRPECPILDDLAAGPVDTRP